MEYIIEVLKENCVIARYTYTDREEAITYYAELDSKFIRSNSISVRYKEVRRSDKI